MPNVRSPEVIVIEKDISQYPASVDSSIVGIVGFANKGPSNVATLITSVNQLIDTFGEPTEDVAGQGLVAALEVLGETNQVYYIRAADEDNDAAASGTIQFGSCPAIAVSSAQGVKDGDAVWGGSIFGVHDDLYLKIQVTDNEGVNQFVTPKKFAIPKGTVVSSTALGSASSQGAALTKVIGGSLDADKVGAFYDPDTAASGMIAGAFAGSGAILSVSAYSTTAYGGDSGNEDFVHCLKALDVDGNPSGQGIVASHATNANANGLFSSINVYGTTFETGHNPLIGVGMPFDGSSQGVKYVAQSLNTGAGYNYGLRSGGGTSGLTARVVSIGGPNVNFHVNDGGEDIETFKVGLVSSNFIEDRINTGTVDRTSDLIRGELYFSGLPDPSAGAVSSVSSHMAHLKDIGLISGVHATWKTPSGAGMQPQTFVSANANTRFNKMVEASYRFTGGATTASAVADLIGTATGSKKTGMQALDDEVLNVSIALVPGVTDQSVQNALITLAEDTQSFIAVVAPPQAVGSAQDAIDWANGQNPLRTAALNSSYAAVYWPWVQVFNVHDAKDRWYDPSIFAAKQMAFTDNNSEPWFAPAGFTRGRLTKPTAVEVKLNKGDRDSLYSGGNVINPIVNFPQQGITIFGQRTTQRAPTALDRVNVRRLMIQLRKIILSSARQFIFEPNDEFTWNKIEKLINPLLRDIQERRGITEFRVVCDETVNTPVRVDRNELWCKVLLKPTKAAEVIIFELNVTNQSAQLGNK